MTEAQPNVPVTPPQPNPGVHVVTNSPIVQSVTTPLGGSTKNKIMTIDTKLNGDLIYNEVKQMPFIVEEHDGHYVEMLQVQSRPIPANIGPKVKEAIDEIAKLRQLTPVYLMINKLPPGKKVEIHRDWLVGTPLQPKCPVIERWHLVLITNKDAKYWDKANGDMKFETGKWYGPVPYWCEHCVCNDGTTERVHLIVDLDTPEPISKYES